MADQCNRMMNGAQCSEVAKWTPKLHVPMKGISLDADAPITAILGLKLCDIHIGLVSTKDFPNLGDLFAELMKGMPADIDRAWFSKVALDSEEYKAWESGKTELHAFIPAFGKKGDLR
jgi:hypothetical protein